MNIDRSVESRAALHAALADPARLQIADLLTLGDWSPSELQARLDVPSNLLAHHLSVLEKAGMVTRGRSEADRRRSYVRLRVEATDGLGIGTSLMARRLVFVCTGNSARSQLAAALWNRASGVPAASGGTHPAERVEPGAVEAASRHHLDLTDQRPRLLTDVVEDGDIVVTVCDNAHEELITPNALHWSVPDPVVIGTDAAFERAYLDLEHRVTELAPRILAA